MSIDTTSKVKTSLLGELFETFGANILLIAFGAFTSIFIARILGPEKRGEFALILLWSGMFSTFASLGINEGLAYFAGSKKVQRWKYLYSALTMTALISLFLIIPFVRLTPFLMKTCSKEAIRLGMLSVGFSVFFIPQFMLAQSFLQGNGLIRHLNLINLSNGFFYLFLVFAVWMLLPRGQYALGLTTASYIGTFLILSFISIALLVMLKKKDSKLLSEKNSFFSSEKMKNLFKYGLPVTVANLVNQASTKLDQIFLSFLVAPQLIGFYAVALSTAVGISGSALTVSTIALPRITGVFNPEEKATVIRKLFQAYLFSAIPIFLLTLVTIPYLIPILFGAEFTGAVKASQMVLIGMVFAGANQLGVTILKALGIPNYAMICRASALGVLAVCLSVLVPKYDIIGAAWAIIFTNITASILIMFLIGRMVRIKIADMIIPKRRDIKAVQEHMVRFFCPRQ